MTSRFVSGGVIAGDGDDVGPGRVPVERSRGDGGEKEASGRERDGERGVGGGVGASLGSSKTSVEWEAVQKDLDEERQRRAEARKLAVEGGAGEERSLYDILQANKAAKQAAFEEQNRIRNQFRALDDDEIEFLHGMSDDKRAEEERVRRETEERLASFRKAQLSVGGAGVGDAGDGGDGDGEAEEWGLATGRKRKRDRERDKSGLKGVRRKTSTSGDDKAAAAGEAKGRDGAASSTENGRVKLAPAKTTMTPAEPETPAAEKPSSAAPAASTRTVDVAVTQKPAFGLVDYGSDEDDEG
ncbi:N-terminal domain of NEFA-interacting nuclear protein NIP30-domain-containing protein [Nemania sp. NC0429]|nr:N-terminal domain of NEFA-interacting nuclear protein NIP30-domain-containing protein [Nemania sp. NC0429]